MSEQFSADRPGHIPQPQRSKEQEAQENKFRLTTLEAFQTPQGENLLKMWNEIYLNMPTWQPGSPEGYAAYRAGQNSIIHLVNNIVKSAQAGGK